MTANQAEFSVSAMASMLGVSRSGFYARLDRAPSARAREDAALLEQIRAFHEASDGTRRVRRASTPTSPQPTFMSGASGSSG